MKTISTLLSRRELLVASLSLLTAIANAADFRPVTCEGKYRRHVQGICTDGRGAIFWSWTESLVKTDLNGRILKEIPVADHHGDLCFHNGRVYVATNLGKFNRPEGEADSWVYVYDAETLAELAKHRVPELVHGAGGIACHDGKFIIVGGLPPGVNENYAYEYDENFRFIKRHVIASGYTLMGIQTVAYADGAWWFGCYGEPPVLLRTDEKFTLAGKSNFNAAVGIAPIGNGRFLIAEDKKVKDTNGKYMRQASIALARATEKGDLALEPPPAR